MLILGDATQIPLKNGSVQYVISNSMIEHITPSRRLLFANEIMRVASKGYFVSTPNYWFPFEPHYHMPLFQFIPQRLKRWLLQRIRIGYVRKEPESAGVLLTKEELARLFPCAEVTGLSFTRLLPETLVAWQRLGVKHCIVNPGHTRRGFCV
jgi:hypothetical protein